MTISFCIKCQREFAYMPNSGNDYVHQCNSGNAVLDNESQLIIGNWTDFTGSDFNINSVNRY